MNYNILSFYWLLLILLNLNPQSISTLQAQNDSVIVVGYTHIKKDNVSAAITQVDHEKFNSGINITPIELIIGKVPGMLITRESGTPGSNFDVTIRGKSALFTYDNPLYVIDGIPLDYKQIDGMRNLLNFINPGDIESFTILKDAGATAIYGGRGSNGVILINTKRGISGKPFQLNYESSLSMSLPIKRETLSSSEFRSLINTKYYNEPEIVGLLGESNTDWQNAISKNAFGQDHLLSLTGGINNLPYRVSFGYTNQDGILKTDQLKRFTTAININPRFFKDHLGVGLGFKGMHLNNRFADPEAIPGAVAFDPTQEVYDPGNPYGGYFYWKDASAYPLKVAADNPLAKLGLTNNEAVVSRLLWNFNIEYKFHFLPELKVALIYSNDKAKSERDVYVPDYAPWMYDPNRKTGTNSDFNQEKNNHYIEGLLAYNKSFKKINSNLDILLGYSMQSFDDKQDYRIAFADDVTVLRQGGSSSTTNITSIFARVSFSLKQRYLIDVSFKRDGHSRYSRENRWSNFPSLSLGWNVHNERFLSQISTLSTLRLCASYGRSGNMMIDNSSFGTFNNSTFIVYSPDLKPEFTNSLNLGLNYGFIHNRIYGTIDFYKRSTSEVINLIPVPGGHDLTNYVLANMGDMENKGVEFSLMTRPVISNNLIWDLGVNLSYNKNKITTPDSEDLLFNGFHTGYISGGVGNTIQIHSPGFPAYSFFVLKQAYDNAGNPIEGVYHDLNNDGEINSEDMYHYKTPVPSFFMGITSELKVKNWDISFLGTMRLGNYIYNNIDSKYAAYQMISPMTGYLNSATPDIYNTQFEKNQYLSDYYVQKASYFRLNYLRIGFDFSELIKGKWRVLVYTTAQNIFTISSYKGPEPEIINGIDYHTYPSPGNFLLGIKVNIN